jgi:hypothetical protein
MQTRSQTRHRSGQPIFLLTHKHTEGLESIWSQLQWSFGDKYVLCDGRETFLKWSNVANMQTILVDSKKCAERLNENSLDRMDLQFKTWDSVILEVVNMKCDFAWIVEYDVSFDPRALSRLAEVCYPWKVDMLFPQGSLVSLSRLSLRLCQEAVDRLKGGKGQYLEELFETICADKCFSRRKFPCHMIHPEYCTKPSRIRTMGLPLHACKHI